MVLRTNKQIKLVFLSDCLETSSDAHLDMLFELLEQNMLGWKTGDALAKRLGA
jgi:hypothetical protein